MKLTEELLQKMEQKKELYGDGIIMPDGDYRLSQDGHLKTLMSLLPGMQHWQEQSLPGIIMTDFIQKTIYQRKQHVPGLQRR